MIHFCSHTFASRLPKQPPLLLQKKNKKTQIPSKSSESRDEID